MTEPEFYEDIAPDLLDLASEQRMGLLFRLIEKKSRVSSMAKRLNATAQEVSRNFDRLSNSGLVRKERDGFYHITTLGKAVCTQIPSLAFLSKNRKYFDEHGFGDLPIKFVQRIGALEKSTHVEGVVRVLEKWKDIYKNANEYVFDVVSEIPPELTEHLIKKIKKGVRYQHIISESAKVPRDRKNTLQKLGFYQLLEKDLIRRRMKKQVTVSVILNEKECAVLFPSKKGDPDLRELFFSQDPLMHEWCVDYFKYCWNIADTFREFKLQE